MSSPIRLILVDDQNLFREGLRTILEIDDRFEMVAEASNGQHAVTLAQEHNPDVLLMDLNMPEMNGIEATQAILQAQPNAKVLVLTTFDDDERVFEALRAGASGYLLKDTPSEQLANAIQTIHRGESYLQPSVASKVLAEFNRLSKTTRPNRNQLIEPLSLREEEVLLLLSQGKNNKEIASSLFLATGTVKNHVSNILGKMGVEDRTQAALKAKELGYI
ncbi:response regulator transcription factor [Puniceicoccaceae bacterium K14]|nr:response regulator transcription factor [Puniceicoccaceae bacterium K14]